MRNFKVIDDAIATEGFTAQQVFEYWLRTGKIVLPTKNRGINDADNSVELIPLSKDNLSQIKPGMIWYYDDTFSFCVIEHKPIKAVVELVERNNVYGDLTANSVLVVEEQFTSWYGAQHYLEHFVYDCEEKERVHWYSPEQMLKVEKNYLLVSPVLEMLGKKVRQGGNWSRKHIVKPFVRGSYLVDFTEGGYWLQDDVKAYFRPVLAKAIR